MSTEPKTYFFRQKEEDQIWFRVVVKLEVPWHLWTPFAEVVELMPDGTGLYVRCKKLPMKEMCFRKLPSDMIMIALQAQSE